MWPRTWALLRVEPRGLEPLTPTVIGLEALPGQAEPLCHSGLALYATDVDRHRPVYLARIWHGHLAVLYYVRSSPRVCPAARPRFCGA